MTSHKREAYANSTLKLKTTVVISFVTLPHITQISSANNILLHHTSLYNLQTFWARCMRDERLRLLLLLMFMWSSFYFFFNQLTEKYSIPNVSEKKRLGL